MKPVPYKGLALGVVLSTAWLSRVQGIQNSPITTLIGCHWLRLWFGLERNSLFLMTNKKIQVSYFMFGFMFVSLCALFCIFFLSFNMLFVLDKAIPP